MEWNGLEPKAGMYVDSMAKGWRPPNTVWQTGFDYPIVGIQRLYDCRMRLSQILYLTIDVDIKVLIFITFRFQNS